MDAKDYTDLIHRYLDGAMPPSEKEAFLVQVKNDKALAHELELVSDIRKGIDLHGGQRLKNLLQNREVKHKKKRNWLVWKVAASLFIAFGVGYLIFQFAGQKSNLYEEYYLAYPNIINPISRSDASAISDGFTYYEQEEYQLAADLLLKQIKVGQDNDTVKFYLAQTYMAMDKTTEAISYLQQISENSRFHEPAEWYLGLAYLRNKRTTEAKEQFNQIAASGSSYAREATELLDKL